MIYTRGRLMLVQAAAESGSFIPGEMISPRKCWEALLTRMCICAWNLKDPICFGFQGKIIASLWSTFFRKSSAKSSRSCVGVGPHSRGSLTEFLILLILLDILSPYLRSIGSMKDL